MKKVINKFKLSKSGQVWVETVIYTLIGLTIIGLLLAVTVPIFEQSRDRALTNEAINALNKIDERVYDTLAGTGNVRKMDVKVGKGELIIDSASDKIFWIMDSEYQFSEEGVEVTAGKVKIITTSKSPWQINLTLEFPFNITYQKQDALKQFSESANPHIITVENLGVIDDSTVISFSEV